MVVLWLTGCAGLGTGQFGADASINTEVKAELINELGTAAANVNTSTEDGVVTLSGTVPNEADHQLALGAATNVDGVKRVVDNLVVKGSKRDLITPEELEPTDTDMDDAY